MLRGRVRRPGACPSTRKPNAEGLRRQATAVTSGRTDRAGHFREAALRRRRLRDSNPCLVSVAFSPCSSVASASSGLKKFDGIQTRTKRVLSKQRVARSLVSNLRACYHVSSSARDEAQQRSAGSSRSPSNRNRNSSAVSLLTRPGWLRAPIHSFGRQFK